MALSINPLAQLVSSVSQQVSSVTNSAGTSLASNISSGAASLDATVNRLSGGIGSGLNGMTSAAQNFVSDAQSAIGGINSALGGAGNPIQSIASNAVSTVSDAVGTISNVSSAIGQSLNKLGAASGSLGGIAQLASQISSAAGAVNNILSLFRGKNLPSGAELFNQQGAVVEVKPGAGADWRVRLDCNFGLFGGAFNRLQETGGMVWPYLPNVTVSTKANYTQIDPIHNIQPFYAFKNSQVEDITISGEFSVENESDGEYWLQATTFLKTATKMFFGQGPNVGNPPVICNLRGYGTRVFDYVPVIVKSFTVDLKDDVNYMKVNDAATGTPTWVPLMSNVSVTVSPIYNRTKLRQFSLVDYANGKAVGYI